MTGSSLGKSVPSTASSMCKGPEVGAHQCDTGPNCRARGCPGRAVPATPDSVTAVGRGRERRGQPAAPHFLAPGPASEPGRGSASRVLGSPSL